MTTVSLLGTVTTMELASNSDSRRRVTWMSHRQ